VIKRPSPKEIISAQARDTHWAAKKNLASDKRSSLSRRSIVGASMISLIALTYEGNLI